MGSTTNIQIKNPVLVLHKPNYTNSFYESGVSINELLEESESPNKVTISYIEAGSSLAELIEIKYNVSLIGKPLVMIEIERIDAND